MNKKKLFVILFASSILFSLIFSIGNCEVVRYKTITITAGGSLDPWNNIPIQRSDNTYTFIDDLFGQLIVEKSDIIIDGNGFAINGAGNSSGIDVQAKADITIKNLTINNHDHGIQLTAFRITGHPIEAPIDWCKRITIFGNNITNNDQGIYGDESRDTIIDENYIKNNNIGISIYFSHRSILRNNELWDNELHLLTHSTTIIEDSNTIDGELLPTSTPTPTPSPEPEFPTTIVVASIATITVIAVAVLVYLKKSRK